MRELAAAGAPIRVPVAVACRVLKLHRQHYYAWLANPVTDSELEEAYLANAIFDAHREDPEFGYRLLFDEITDAGHVVSERTVWKICSANEWWCVFGKKRRGKKGLPGAPAHDDLVRREFTAPGPNQVWLTDISEHPTAVGKLYICAVKDVWSNRIVGYSIADRMTSQLAVDALESAVARRGGSVAGCKLHSDRGGQGGINRSSQHPVMEVLSGTSSASSRSSDPAEASVAGAPEVPASCRGRVLGRDRQWLSAHRGRRDGRRGASGRSAVVPPRWRHGAVRPDVQAHRPVPVVR